MEQQTVIHSTFVIERSYQAAPERVFKAFADAEAKGRWFGVGEHHDIEEFAMDFRVGGKEFTRYRFNETTPFKGVLLINEGSFQDIVPNRRIVTASKMTFGDKCISVSLVTIEMLRTDRGTDLICTHQGAFFEGADGPEIREDGWRKLLDKLALELAG